ncbi:hypothetical protein RRG08_060205 [Elysia crispata]|uniref:CCHC-type domain-containing protein n=1 Tax=Elysia crispata TaxID=231223 RepID=A0AAE0ZNN6_9GAST|nr:hypothetical protein RRG08_060205 [Elysia crispata]
MPEKAKADDFNRPQCHICGKSGHRAKDCFKRGAPKNPQQPLKCDVCKKVGHVKENCWSRQKPAASVVLTKETDDFYKIQMSATCSSNCDVTGMPVAEGQLEGDSSRARYPSLAHNVCALPMGRLKRFPRLRYMWTVLIIKGSVEAALLDNPLFDLILGNIEGAKCPGTRVGGSLEAAAVETRAACRRELKKLKTPKENDLGLSVEELKALQKEDPSLEQARKNAETGDIIHTGRANESRYTYQKGVLMRHFKSPLVEHGDVVKQVVVPTCLRHKVMTLAHDSILAGHLAAKKTEVPAEEKEEQLPEKGLLQCSVSAIVSEVEEADEMGDDAGPGSNPPLSIDTPELQQTEGTGDVNMYGGLEAAQQEQLREVLKEFSDVFTDVPGQTHLIEHDIQLTSTDPIRKRPYPVLYRASACETMREEVDMGMIKAGGIIEPSSSPYCHYRNQ